MNKQLLALGGVLALATIQGAFAAPNLKNSSLPHLINFAPAQTFLPPGFDDNDRSQLVIAGFYPNTCFKQGPTQVSVDQKNKKITLQHQAYYYESSWCLQMLVPYQETVDMGILSAGEYKVSALDEIGKDISAGKLPISVAKSNEPDEHLYAPIEQAFVDKNAANGPQLVLTGTFPGGCTEIGEVKVLHRQDNLVEVLPLAEPESHPGCDTQNRDFEKRVKLPAGLSGSTLVYIRYLNGKAVTRVIEF